MGLNTTYDAAAEVLTCHDSTGSDFRLFIDAEHRLWLTYLNEVRTFDRTQAKELAAILTHFAETGEIPEPTR